MREDISDIGSDLVEYSKSKKRAVTVTPVTELYPFIFEASKNMGVREISRWLSEKKKISISPSTISRALRFSAPQWEGFSSLIEPAMRTLESSGVIPSEMGVDWEVSVRKFMASEKIEERIDIHQTCEDIIKSPTQEIMIKGLEAKSALELLESTWFILERSTRGNCFPYIFEEDQEP